MTKKGNVYVLPVKVFNSRSKGVTIWDWATYAIIAKTKLHAALSISNNTECENMFRIPKGQKFTKSCLDKHPYATENGVFIA